MSEFETIEVAIANRVATVRLIPPSHGAINAGASLHWELGEAMSQLRGNDRVRVVVLTGTGDEFLALRPPESYRTDLGRRGRTEPQRVWSTFTGIRRMHEQMVEIEKPIIAKVNGDAVGFGSSLMFACDLIVAREDAKIIDIHMGMGEVENAGPSEVGFVPGDGGTALVPLFMSPVLAKEYLMLARPFLASDLARLGIINYAVPITDLKETVDDIVVRLLHRSAYALAWTKRAANRIVADQMNRSLDAGLGYEMATFLQWQQMGWADTKDLDSGVESDVQSPSGQEF